MTFWVSDTFYISGTLFISALHAQGDDPIKSSLNAPFIFILITSCAVSVAAAAAFLPADRLQNFFSDPDSENSQLLNQNLQRISPQKRAQNVAPLLDSLGFFHSTYDSLSGKYSPGHRAVIIAEQLIRNDRVKADLKGAINYPRAFDAGEVKMRALFLNRIYAENGFPFATVTIDSKNYSCDSLKDSLTIIYEITSDQISYFSSAVFKTHYKTSPALLSKYINLKKGELFDLRKIESSVKRLKSRSFIADAFSLDPFLMSDSSARDSAAFVTIPFEVRDRSGLGFEGVAGFESNQDNTPRLKGKAELSLLNMFHSGESASFRYQGDDLMQQFDLSFSMPLTLNTPLQVGGNFGMELQTNIFGYVYGNFKLLTEFNQFWYSGIALQYNETSTQSDIIGSGGTFFGVDFLLIKAPEIYSRNILSSDLAITIGSGIAKKNKSYTRSHVDFSMGTHVPFFHSQAIYSRLVTSHIISDEKTLLPVELNRVGGHNSIRGYSDNEFAFRTALFGQLEVIHYFNMHGSLFILIDGGIGFEDEPRFGQATYSKLMGYGLGVRIPSRLGMITLEWARNYQDKKNLGRVHVQFQNDLSRITGKFM